MQTNKPCNFSTVEFDINNIYNEKIFNSFYSVIPFFTYQLKLNSINIHSQLKFLLKIIIKYKIKNIWLNFSSFKECLKLLPKIKIFKNILNLKLAINCQEYSNIQIQKYILRLYTKLQKLRFNNLSLRLYKNISNYNEAINLIKNTSKKFFIKNFYKISLCFFLNNNPFNIINFYHLIISKNYLLPKINLHIEYKTKLSLIENSILFSLKFLNLILDKCSIMSKIKYENEDNFNNTFLDTLEILRSLEFNNIPGVYFISCPTCARCKINVIKIANNIYNKIKLINYPIKVAVMGCEVNGPGEAIHADIGLAGTKFGAIIFQKGKVTEKLNTTEKLEDIFYERILNFLNASQT